MSSFLHRFRQQRDLRAQNEPQSSDPLKGPTISERTDSDHSRRRHAQQTETPIRRLLSWWPELLSTFLSVGTLIAVAAVLYSIDGEPLEKWNLPWQIKPNTVISTLITLVRLWMLLVVAECVGQLKWVYFEQKPHRLIDFETFDSASRGPWGAVNLLCRIRWKALAASLGALLMVLALAVDPFAQQVLSYAQRTTISPSGQATLWSAKSYDYDTHDSLNPSSITKNNGLSAASLMALLPNTMALPNDVRFDCPSGNCTWSSFQSLGICSSCHDVSATTKKSCKYERGQVIGSPEQDHNLACKYTTPKNDIQLEAQYSASVYPNGTKAPDVDYGGITPNRPDGSEQRFTLFNSSSVSTIITDAKHAELLSYSALSHPEDYNLQWKLWSNHSKTGWPEPTVYDCTLSWCLKTYAAGSSLNGKLNEPEPVSEELSIPYYMFAGEATDGDSSFHSCMSVTEAMDWQETRPLGTIDVDMDQSVAAAYKKSDLPKTKTCPTPAQINNSTTAWGINIQDQSLVQERMYDMLERELSSDFVSSTTLDQLFWSANDGNISTTLEKISTRMTNSLRQDGPNITTVTGEVQYLATHIQVNWPWLAYPATLVFLTVVFLILTMVFSAEKSRVVWKSSSLAVLFHGPQVEIMDTRSRGMDDEARKMLVRLMDDDGGNLRLVRT